MGEVITAKDKEYEAERARYGTGREPVDERPREQPLAAPAVGRIRGVP